jgi:hypothetical protein
MNGTQYARTAKPHKPHKLGPSVILQILDERIYDLGTASSTRGPFPFISTCARRQRYFSQLQQLHVAIYCHFCPRAVVLLYDTEACLYCVLPFRFAYKAAGCTQRDCPARLLRLLATFSLITKHPLQIVPRTLESIWITLFVPIAILRYGMTVGASNLAITHTLGFQPPNAIMTARAENVALKSDLVGSHLCFAGTKPIHLHTRLLLPSFCPTRLLGGLSLLFKSRN